MANNNVNNINKIFFIQCITEASKNVSRALNWNRAAQLILISYTHSLSFNMTNSSSLSSTLPLGPSIADASQTSALFQTDQQIADGLRRREKKDKQLGNPIELPSKILCMILAPGSNSSKDSSSDGQTAYAYVGNSNHTARKVNLLTGKTVKLYKGHAGPVTSVAAFCRCVESTTGKKEEELLLSGSWDKTLCLWNAETKEALLTLRGHSDFIKAVVIGKDHLIDGASQAGHPTTAYSVSADGTARRWSLVTGACLGVYENEHRGQVESVTITIGPNPTLKKLEDGSTTPTPTTTTTATTIREWLWTAGTDGTVRCWDIDTCRCVATLTGHDTSIFDVHTSAIEGVTGDMWTASADKTVRRWDLETCTEDTALEHPDAVRSVSVIGPYAMTGCRDEHVRAFDIASGQLIATMEGHYDEIMSIIAHNGILYTGSLDSTIRRWPISEDEFKESAESEQPVKRDNDLLTEEEERELAELMSDLDE
ncbi:WD40-repeat-containing domain protein [Syncephalis fuscata]|nr:WD40-repeat-containing domain protein [Syncephalis fuscata]